MDVINFFFLVPRATSWRSIGPRNCEAMAGRTRPWAWTWTLLQSASTSSSCWHTQLQDHELGIKADNELMDAAHSLIETYAKGGSADPIVIEREITTSRH